MNAKALPVVQTAGLTKIFKDFWRRDRVAAVNDLDLEVRRGEVFGLLGPNGSGKSTTIKMLLGLLYPTRGRISVFGKAPTDVGIKARIGFLPEESYLYRFLDARETLDLYARLFRQNRKQRADRIDKLLDMVGLQEEAGRRIGEYSKGMARRIGLAQALVNDPEFLILDEPTAGLDPIGIRQIKDVIRELGKKGKTILLSSHLLGDVEDVCDRVMILYGGRQRAAGTIDELLRQEDRTQITTEKLAPETIQQVGDLIHRVEGKKILKVGAPTDRLEAVFMKTVQQAQAENVASAGVRLGGALPDFLGTTEPKGVVESLVSAANQDSETPPTEPVERRPPAEPEEPSRSVIEELTKTAPPETNATPDGEPSAGAEPAAKFEAPLSADRSVIESLMRPEQDQDRG